MNKVRMRSYLLLALAAALSGCIARDVYPKYIKMKEEAGWITSQCPIVGEGVQTVYKGSLASVRLQCTKPLDKINWQKKFQSLLVERGYKHIRDAYPPVEIYCFGNTGIKLHYSEDERFQFGFFYPDKECLVD
jgi:hypothetical protein